MLLEVGNSCVGSAAPRGTGGGACTTQLCHCSDFLRFLLHEHDCQQVCWLPGEAKRSISPPRDVCLRWLLVTSAGVADNQLGTHRGSDALDPGLACIFLCQCLQHPMPA